MKTRKKKSLGIETIRGRYGYTFVAHWMLGLILFFIVPILSSVWYAFSEVTFDANGIVAKFQGIETFRYLLVEDPYYLNNLRDAVFSMLTSLPIIMALSLIFAVMLNREFIGRTVARAIFFLPIIISSSVVMTVLSSDYVRAPLFIIQSGAEYDYGSVLDFNDILQKLQIPSQINNILEDYINNVMNLIWSCGVQTILFLAGLQSIPTTFYEVSKVEGANRWEEFWMITVPMLRHVIPLVMIFTMIELFLGSDNALVYNIIQLFSKQIYDRSSAMLWMYFSVVLIIIGGVFVLYTRFSKKRWE